MNKHLLETKLKSIAHYDSELKRLKEASEINRSVHKELVDSLIEFFPFVENDIIIKGDTFYKIKRIDHSSINADGSVSFLIEYYITNSYNSFEPNNTRTQRIFLSDIDNWKKAN